MKRKDFFKAAFFGIAACFLPKITMAETKFNTDGLKHGGVYPFGIINDKGEMLTQAQVANLKLQHALIKSAPPGKYVDLKYLSSYIKRGYKKINKKELIKGLTKQTITKK